MNKPFRRTPGRVMAGFVAALLTVAGLAAIPAGATALVTTSRTSGATRYDTAAALAKAAYPGATNDVVLATGEGFADALAAAALAGKLNAPILTTPKDSLHTAAANALGQFKPLIGKVWILGGTVALSQAVQDAVTALGYPTQRVAGADRYETAKLVGDQVGTANVGTLAGKKVAVVATGGTFADALAIGPASFAMKWPVLLTTPTALHAMASAGLTALGIGRVVLLGGTTAVSAAVETAITAMGITVTRIGGANRNDTAAKISDALTKDATVGGLGTNATFTGVNVGLASGAEAKGGVDALAAAPFFGGTQLAGGVRATLLLTGSVPVESSAWLTANKATVANLYAAGGTATISDADLAELKTAASTTAPTGTITAQANGTFFAVTFSEAMSPGSAVAPANFLVNGVASGGVLAYDPATKTTSVVGVAALAPGSTITALNVITPDGRAMAQVNFTVMPDVTKPAVATIFAVAGESVAYVKFNEQMLPGAAGGGIGNAANYGAPGLGAVTANTIAISNMSARLATGVLAAGNTITVNATVADASGNTLPTSVTFTVPAPVDTTGPSMTAATQTLAATTSASLVVAGTTISAKSTGTAPGVLGEGWSFQIVIGGGSPVVAVNSAATPLKTITVTAPAGTTEQQLVDALTASSSFSGSFSAATSTPGAAIAGTAATPLAGGASTASVAVTFSELMDGPTITTPAGVLTGGTTFTLDGDGAGVAAALILGVLAGVDDNQGLSKATLTFAITAIADVPQPGVATITTVPAVQDFSDNAISPLFRIIN